MNPRMCTIKHNPPHTYGDCVKACIATLIDRDDVPHVFDDRPPIESWEQIRAYLKSIGYNLFAMDTEEDPRPYMAKNNPDVAYLLLCSNRDGNHAVVCVGEELVHDPNWYKTAIVGPTNAGVYFLMVITHQS